MPRFPMASAVGEPPEKMIEHCLRELHPLREEANLGFLYASDHLAGDLGSLVQRLREELPGTHWVGSLGIGLCTTGREIYDQPALAVMLGSFPPDSFRTLRQGRQDNDDLLSSLAGWAGGRGYYFALLHGDPSGPGTAEMLQRLAESSEQGFINGGITSSGGENLQVCDGVTSGGLSGVMFNGEVRVLTDHTQGCTPIGRIHELTRAQRNIAVTLDHRPALEVMKEEIGEILARDLTRIGGHIFAAFPIEGSDTGDYLVRNLMGFDPEQGLLAVGDYLEGEKSLMFCRRDGNTARADMQRMLERLRRRVGEDEIRGGVYVSCLGRGRHQFGEDSEELVLIRDTLGDFPLVGFFASGEIYHGRLYGYTGVLTLFL